MRWSPESMWLRGTHSTNPSASRSIGSPLAVRIMLKDRNGCSWGANPLLNWRSKEVWPCSSRFKTKGHPSLSHSFTYRCWKIAIVIAGGLNAACITQLTTIPVSQSAFRVVSISSPLGNLPNTGKTSWCAVLSSKLITGHYQIFQIFPIFPCTIRGSLKASRCLPQTTDCSVR